MLNGRLVHLRPIAREDIDRGWLEWINDPTVLDGLMTRGALSREDLDSYFANSQWPAAAMFAICRNRDDLYVGNARLSDFDWIHRGCTYGYLLSPDAQGGGLGSEALFLICRYAFMMLGMNRISTGVSNFNLASIRSNEKVGFQREGNQRQRVYRNGTFHDGVALAILRDDFDELYPDASLDAYWARVAALKAGGAGT